MDMCISVTGDLDTGSHESGVLGEDLIYVCSRKPDGICCLR
jgi:hypothetical protein